MSKIQRLVSITLTLSYAYALN